MTINGLTIAVIAGVLLGIGLVIEKWNSEDESDDD